VLEAAPRPRLASASRLPLPEPAARAATLRRLAREHQLQRTTLRVVLCPGQYDLLQTEAPPVADDELARALRWSIRELLDYPADDALIETFELPRHSVPGQPRLLSVVAARKAQITALLGELADAGLEPASIDIAELALRNLATACAGRSGGEAELAPAIASLFLLPQQTCVEITRQRLLLFTRQIAVAGEPLLHAAAGDAGRKQSRCEAICLELQRSLDHFERHSGLGGVRRLQLFHGAGDSRTLAARASEQLNIEVQRADLAELLPGAKALDPALLGACLPAIGGALRDL